MEKEITKVVIPAAGLGTRFLPITKAVPKEMLPIIDRPVIQYVVDEAVASGMKDIILVTSWQKKAIEDYFDYSFELEQTLTKSGKEKELKEIRSIASMANFTYIRQKGPYGNATPVLCSKNLISHDEFFAVMWGDEFIHADPPRLKQMIDVHRETQGAVISAVRVKPQDVSRYGIVSVEEKNNSLLIKEIVEKPEASKAPSNLAAHGAYILPGRIFPILEKLNPGQSGEFWLVDAISELIKENFPVYACEIKNGHYYDAGNKAEYLKANIDFALERKDLRDEIKEYIKKKSLEC
jgi:UTP--glucose-1-phosphate uridylyltransferase